MRLVAATQQFPESADFFDSVRFPSLRSRIDAFFATLMLGASLLLLSRWKTRLALLVAVAATTVVIPVIAGPKRSSAALANMALEVLVVVSAVALLVVLWCRWWLRRFARNRHGAGCDSSTSLGSPMAGDHPDRFHSMHQ